MMYAGKNFHFLTLWKNMAIRWKLDMKVGENNPNMVFALAIQKHFLNFRTPAPAHFGGIVFQAQRLERSIFTILAWGIRMETDFGGVIGCVLMNQQMRSLLLS